MEDRAALIRRLLDSWRPVIGGNAVDLIRRHLWVALPSETALAGAAHIAVGKSSRAALITYTVLATAADGKVSAALGNWKCEVDGRHTVAGIEVSPDWHLQMSAVVRDVACHPKGWHLRYLPVYYTSSSALNTQSGDMLMSIGGVRLEPPVCIGGVAAPYVREMLDDIRLRGEIGDLELGIAMVAVESLGALSTEYWEYTQMAYSAYLMDLRSRLENAVHSSQRDN